MSSQWPNHFNICYCFPAMSLQDVAKYEDVVYSAPVSCCMWIVLYKSCGSSDMCFEVFGVSLKALGPVSFVWLDDEFYTGRICCLWKIDFCVEELPTYFLRLTSKYNKCYQGSLVLKRMGLCISVCGNLCMYSGLFSYLIIINYQTYVTVTRLSLCPICSHHLRIFYLKLMTVVPSAVNTPWQNPGVGQRDTNQNS